MDALKTSGDAGNSLQRSCDSLLSKINQFEDLEFQRWSDDHEMMVDNPAEALPGQNGSRWMELDPKDGHLTVNFSDSLVKLLRDTRQLRSLGYNIPKSVSKYVENSRQFYRYGMVLKQIAHIYNTMDSQMIPSQQPMLLALAIHFENLIKNPPKSDTTKRIESEGVGPNELRWEGVEDITKYITQLQQSVGKLLDTNRQLRQHHGKLMEHVIQLSELDLLRQQPRWKLILGQMRQLIVDVKVQGGFSDEMMFAWVRHWEYQLYKVLEVQWCNGVLTLSTVSYVNSPEDEESNGESMDGRLGRAAIDLEVELVMKGGKE
jgi:dynein heavy chain 2